MYNKIIHNTASIISREQNSFSRPRVNKLFEQAIENPLTIVSAGAGYGKTYAVYAFLQNINAVTIWFQLSIFDNLASKFWESLIKTLSAENEYIANELKNLGFPTTKRDCEIFLSCISKALNPDEKYIFVCDDFHLIDNADVIRLINVLINAHLPRLSIILISRKDPELDIKMLQTKHLLSTIDQDDLCFTENEVFNCLQEYGVHLSSEMITETYNYTEGWAFAVSLTGISLKNKQIYSSYALSEIKANVFKLFESEVFSVVSEETKAFLIKLSLIETIPKGLMTELFPGDKNFISELKRLSCFIRYDDCANCYKIRNLFLSFLHEKQYKLSSNEKRNIYLKAAKWYEKNGYRIDAIIYYEKINKYNEIIKIISSYTEVSLDTADFILKVLDRARISLDNKNFDAEILRIRFLMLLERFDEARIELKTLRQKYEAKPVSEKRREALSGIYINMGLLSLYNGSYVKQYFKLADMESKSLLNQEYPITICNYACVVTKPDKGEFDKFLSEINETLIHTRVIDSKGFAYTDLAQTEYAFFKRDLASAEKHAYNAIYNAQRNDQYHIECLAYFYLIRSKIALGDYKKINELLDELKTKNESCEISSSRLLIFDIVSAWFYCLIGQFDKAATFMQYHDNGKTVDCVNYDLERLIQAKIKLSQKKYFESLAIIESINDKNGMICRGVLGRIEISALKAVAMYRINEYDEALKALCDAYRLSEPNELYMPFVEQGNNMRTLINVAMRNKYCDIPLDWLEMIHTKSSTYAKKLSNVTNEYSDLCSADKSLANLSNRELEVLIDLCHGLSRIEISMNRSLSVNTVKSMLKNIYTKLGAINTFDAMRIAFTRKLVE